MQKSIILILSFFILQIFIRQASAQANFNFNNNSGYLNQYQPKSGSKYDWKSGNQYNWSRQYNGDTTVRGYNFNTGSQWNTTIKKNGDMKGLDSNFNQWTYDKKTGSYFNYGTLTRCVGHGVNRYCY